MQDVTARQLQQEIGGESCFFFHDSDHDRARTINDLARTTFWSSTIGQFPIPELDSEGFSLSMQSAFFRTGIRNGTAAAKLR